MDEVLAYLKANKTYYLATVHDGRPEVRPFGTAVKFEGKLYIQTGRVKDVYKQITACPQVALCTSAPDGTWLRISATAVEDTRMETSQAVLDEYPELGDRYQAGDGNCTEFYLKDAVATFSSFTEEPRTVRF